MTKEEVVRYVLCLLFTFTNKDIALDVNDVVFSESVHGDFGFSVTFTILNECCGNLFLRTTKQQHKVIYIQSITRRICVVITILASSGCKFSGKRKDMQGKLLFCLFQFLLNLFSRTFELDNVE